MRLCGEGCRYVFYVTLSYIIKLVAFLALCVKPRLGSLGTGVDEYSYVTSVPQLTVHVTCQVISTFSAILLHTLLSNVTVYSCKAY